MFPTIIFANSNANFNVRIEGKPKIYAHNYIIIYKQSGIYQVKK